MQEKFTPMSYFGKVLIFTLLLLIATPVIVGRTSNQAEFEEQQFTVMTYNVGMLEGAPGKKNKKRAREMHWRLRSSNMDVIVFTELFTKAPKNILLDGPRKVWPSTKFPFFSIERRHGLRDRGYEFRGPPDRDLRRNGGVLIGTPHRIEDSATHVFNAQINARDLTWFHAKGVVYAEIVKDGDPYHVFATHVQHGCEDHQLEERRQHFQEIGQFIRRQDIGEDEAIVLAGDFNVGHGQTGDCERMDVAEMLDIISRESRYDFIHDNLTIATAKGGEPYWQETLDHIFAANRSVLVNENTYRTEEWYLKDGLSDHFKGETEDGDQVRFLSDHHPLAANFLFSPFELRIDRPPDGLEIDELDPVPLQATLLDPSASQYSIKWSYIKGGTYTPLKSTPSGALSSADPLCSGTYEFSARVSGTWLKESVTVHVEDAPNDEVHAECSPDPDEILIDQPSEGAVYQQGEQIYLDASVSHNPPRHPVIWRQGGPSGRILDAKASGTTKFGTGTHKIWAGYGDASDSVTVEVVATENSAPSISIESPEDGAYIDERVERPYVEVALTATASDAEDGPLTGSAVEWWYKRVGKTEWRKAAQTGTSVTLVLPDDNCGSTPYAIKVVATDSRGLTDQDIIEVDVFWIGC